MAALRQTSVILDLRRGERIAVSGQVFVQLLSKSGNLARLRITAPEDVPIKKEQDGPQHDPSMTKCIPS